MKGTLTKTENLVKIALLSAIAALLMGFFKFSLPIFPAFLEVDFSEVPVIIGILTISPSAGIVIVILKNLLKVMLTGTTTAYVGEFANMIISIGYILPLMWFTRKGTDMKNVRNGLICGVISMAIVGALSNYFITLPMYATLYYGGTLQPVIEMGHAIVPAIHDKLTFVLFSIIPFNIFKGSVIALTSIVFVKAIYPALRVLKTKRA